MSAPPGRLFFYCNRGWLNFIRSYAKNRGVKKFFHQSYVFVAMCFGVICGTILAIGFRWNFFASLLVLLLALLILIYAFCYPSRTFLVLAFLAGMSVAFKRCSGGGEFNPEQIEIVVKIKDWFAANIDYSIGGAESKLGLAYMLGIKESLPSDLNNMLKAVGLAHIVVASGTHLGILVGIVQKTFGRISRRVGLIATIIFVMFFMLLVGLTPSILRAGIVTMLSVSMWYVGRKFAPWRIILIAATITLLINPEFITNLGWLLSFASFIGVMVLAPRIQWFFYGRDKPNFVARTIITTVAATLATLPLTIFYFGSFSLLAIFANLLILPTLPYAMGLTFLSGLPIIGLPFGALAKLLLGVHIGIVNFLAEQNYFIVKIGERSTWVFLFYVLVLPLLIIKWRKRRRRSIMKA